MFDVETALNEYPEIKSKFYISDMNIRNSDNTLVFYVPVERVVEVARNGFISLKQLENFEKELSEKYSIRTQVIVTSSSKFESVARASELLLKANFTELVEEANFTFLSAEKVNAWIKATSSAKEHVKAIELFLKSTLISSGVKYINFQWVFEEGDLPSLMNILVATKLHQPVTLDAFVENVAQKHRDINRTWLNRQLDKLIKRKLVVRDNHTGTYSLTGLGLGVIPTLNGKNSTDIARALDLGKRKW